MSKTIIFLSAIFTLAFIFVEILIRTTINHPTYNIEKKLYGLRKSNNGITDIYFPHSRIWTSEGGYSISITNNLGLPGSDVLVTDTTKYIYVLGSSYVQANQVAPTKVSTTICQSRLGASSKYQVLNLGEGGLDQYDSYFKLKYYEKFYKPEKIFLMIERVDERWLSRHDTLNFALSENLGREIHPNTAERIERFVRKNSSFLNILSNGYKIASNTNFRSAKIVKTVNDPNLTRNEDISKKLLICLDKFREDYGSNFIVVSIIDNPEINIFLDNFCRSKNIIFKFSPINRTENKLNIRGHLNEKGNEELGNFLYEILKNEIILRDGKNI